ncbi:putative transcriptional regulatory protein ResD [Streptococcus sp. oral taxon 056 str. F0418]|nr:putative transcriptional regulatory protein ResD [Streptococcus sp. oral taxon 056 str. F0418]
MQANLRRGQVNITKTVLEYKRLTLYPDSRQLLVDDKEVILTAHEFDILQLLMSQPDKVFSREQLYQAVWKDGYYGENNTVNVHISNIRKKLKEQLPDEVIQTIYGIGFKLV